MNINSQSPIQILNELAGIFERSRENRDIDGLEKGLQLSSQVDLDRFGAKEKCRFHYFVSNGWSYELHLKCDNPDKAGEYILEFEKQIYHLRLALSYIDEADDFDICQVLTNLGCLFSEVGRYVDAQYYFNWALAVNPDFGMALANKGYGLYRYARELFVGGHQSLFLKYARKCLKKASGMDDVYGDIREWCLQLVSHIEQFPNKGGWEAEEKFPDVFNDSSEEEIDYRKWCLDNVLVLNPLNDVLRFGVAACDDLYVPAMTLQRDEKPVYLSVFNQIKQEFVSARFFFYDGVYNNGKHYSDNKVSLYRVFDMPLYSLNIEKVKVAFRLCYSIFDKIAYLLNIYLKLGIASNKVSFRNIWHENANCRNPIRDDIFKESRSALRGLFWLSKDLDEKGDSPIEPEAKEIATIRNYIEHKSFKVVESVNEIWSETPETYEIEEYAFYDKTLKLLRLTRSALIYLASAIYEEESSKVQDGRPVLPVILTAL